MTPTRTPGRSSTSPARPADAGRPARARGAASVLALQRAAGNASAVALLRRAHNVEDEPPGIDGTLVVSRLTPLGWVRRLTVTMTDCLVDQYMVHEGDESIRLAFSRAQVDQ